MAKRNDTLREFAREAISQEILRLQTLLASLDPRRSRATAPVGAKPKTKSAGTKVRKGKIGKGQKVRANAARRPKNAKPATSKTAAQNAAGERRRA